MVQLLSLDEADRLFETRYRAALRHSRFVVFLRSALPSLAVLTLIFFVLRSLAADFLPAVSLGQVSITTEGIVLENPQLSGHDSGDRAYAITADRAIQSISNPKEISLAGVEARIDLSDKQWLKFSAGQGTFDGADEKIVLNDDIQITTSSHYTAKLRSAFIDLKNGILTSDQPVVLTSPSIELSAETVVISENERILTFVGNVFIRLDPSKGRQ